MHQHILSVLLLNSKLAPMEDRNQFRLQLTAVEGTVPLITWISTFRRWLHSCKYLIPEAKTAFSVTAPGFAGAGSVNMGFVRVTLTDPNERDRSQQEIVDMVSRNLSRFPEGRAFPIQEQTISVNRRGGLPVQFVIQHNNFEKLKEVLPKFLEAANANPFCKAWISI